MLTGRKYELKFIDEVRLAVVTTGACAGRDDSGGATT